MGGTPKLTLKGVSRKAWPSNAMELLLDAQHMHNGGYVEFPKSFGKSDGRIGERDSDGYLLGGLRLNHVQTTKVRRTDNREI